MVHLFFIIFNLILAVLGFVILTQANPMGFVVIALSSFVIAINYPLAKKYVTEKLHAK